MMHAIRSALVSFACCGATLLATLPAAAQNQQWIRQLGTGSNDNGWAAAPDGSGGVYIAGYTEGNLGGPNAGYTDAWLSRYDSAGNQLWIRQLGTPQEDRAWAAAPDGSGGVYITGYTEGNLGGPSAGSEDAWLAHYDGAGTQLWMKQFGTSDRDPARAAAPDGSGGVYVSGWTLGNLGGPSAGFADIWLAHYDSAGNQLWIRQFGSSIGDIPNDAAPDGSGGVYLSGDTSGSLGGPNAGSFDAWLARYDSAGNQLWVRQLGTSGDDFGYADASDSLGGVYIGGETEGSLGGPNAGGDDAWLARYDSAGNQLWIHQIGTVADDSSDAAAPDGSGGVYISGETYGSLGGPNAGQVDTWLANYDGTGNRSWIGQLGSIAYDYNRAAVTDGPGVVYVSGYTYGSLGGQSTGASDAWLARYDSCSPPATYCTAKTSTSGCLPSISMSTCPNASAGSGCTVQTANTEGNRFGNFFHSINAKQAAPFHGGFLCMKPPIVRHLSQNSGGTKNTCTGVFSEDLNAYIASGADPALVAGVTVYVQTWGRDPAAPFGDTLSDAVEALIGP